MAGLTVKLAITRRATLDVTQPRGSPEYPGVIHPFGVAADDVLPECLLLLTAPNVCHHVVGDGIPCVVNAAEQQQ